MSQNLESWTDELSLEEVEAIASRGLGTIAKRIPLKERRDMAATFRELDYCRDELQKGNKSIRFRMECRKNGCFRNCIIYWGKRCKRLGGRKIPRIRGELTGRLYPWT